MNANVQIRVRLPGSTTPEEIEINSDLTAKEGVQVIAQTLAVEKLKNARLVIAPTNKKNGAIVTQSSVFKSIMFNPKTDILELWKAPAMMNVAIFFRENGQDNLRDKKMIPIDFEAGLVHMVPTIQRALDLPLDQEFSFQYATAITDGKVEKPRWITTQLSLDEQEATADGVLLCYPLSKLMKTPEASVVAAERGMLFKRSMKKDRTTSKQRRLFVLSGPFLFYFKKERDTCPAGVIPLEYYVVRKKLNKKRKFSMMLTLAYDGFRNMTGSYKLQADTLEQMEVWFEKIKKRCVNSGNKKVFGVDMKEVIMRKSNQNRFLPRLVITCMNFIEEKGLDLEGVFRISASASIVEYYKDQYDSGEDVSFESIYDFHIPAALLKQYFRELPEPLFTYDLYDRYIDCGLKHEPSQLGDIMAELPVENFVTCKALFEFLHKVAEHEEVNKMGAANLATVFGPNLVRERADAPNVQHFGILNTIVQSLITHHEAVFKHAETVNPKYAKISPGIHDPVAGGAPRAAAPAKTATPAAGRGRGGMPMGAMIQQMKDRQQQPRASMNPGATPLAGHPRASVNPGATPLAGRGGGGRGGPGRGRGRGAGPPVAPRRDMKRTPNPMRPGGAPAPGGLNVPAQSPGGASAPPAVATVSSVTPAAGGDSLAPPASARAAASPSPMMAKAKPTKPVASPKPSPAKPKAVPSIETSPPEPSTFEEVVEMLKEERAARISLEEQVQQLLARVQALEEEES